MDVTLQISITMILPAFFCGALSFSARAGKIFLELDRRQFGDANLTITLPKAETVKPKTITIKAK